jgi:hypothetical protein
MVAVFGMARRPAWLSFEGIERAVWATCEDVASLWPDRWRSRLLPRSNVLLLDAPREGPSVTATLPDGRRTELDTLSDVAAFRRAAARSTVVLRLDDAEVLSTVLKLPRRAASRLDEVVATNIPVWTPFAADDLFFKARVASVQATDIGDGRQPTCDVELRCIPRAALVPRLSMLADRFTAVDELWLGKDRSFSCDLGSRKMQAMRRKRRIALALMALAAVQVCALPMIYRLHQDERIALLQDHLDRVRKVVHARAARTQMDQDAARMLSAVQERASGQDSMTYLLKRLAAVLPTGARYRELSVTSTAGGSLMIVSRDKIDPVSLVAATGLLTVTEVNEMNGAQEGEHVYAVAFKAVRSTPDPN